MKKILIILILMMGVNNQADAQFFQKLGNAIDKAAKKVDKAVQTVDKVASTILGEPNTTPQNKTNQPNQGTQQSNNSMQNGMGSDENNVYKSVNQVLAKLSPICSNCNSFQQLETHINEIRNIEGVTDVSSDGITTMNVYIDGFGPLSFTYPLAVPMVESIRFPSSNSGDKKLLNSIKIKKIAIAYQFKYDLIFKDFKNRIDEFAKILKDTYDIEVTIVDPTLDFYRKGMYEYDFVILCTHGTYINKLHYLMTTEGAGFASDPNNFNVDEVNPSVRNKYTNEFGDIKKGLWRLGCSIEKRMISNKEKPFNIMYTMVSENMIRDKSECSFDPNKHVIVFNAACHSFEESNSLARVFLDKGASLYLGYDNTNSIGVLAALEFLGRLLSGYTVEGALESLDDDVKINNLFGGIVANLKYEATTSGFLKKSYYSPVVIDKSVDFQDDNNITISVRAQIPVFHYYVRQKSLTEDNTFEIIINRLSDLEKSPLVYGFELSKTSDFSSVSPNTRRSFSFKLNMIDKYTKLIGGELRSGFRVLDDYFFTFDNVYHEPINSDFWDKNLNKCYVRAFVYDGKNYNYSEPEEIKISVPGVNSTLQVQTYESANDDNTDESEYANADVTSKLDYMYSNGEYTISNPHGYYRDGYCGNIIIPSTAPFTEYKIDDNGNVDSTKIQIPVTKISSGAFAQDKYLKSVTVGDNIESIGFDAFSKSGIRSIYIPDNVKEIDSGICSGCHQLKSFRLPSGIKEIPGHTFSDCTSLEKVDIPSGVERIGGSAFSDCVKLTTVTLNEGLKFIGSSAFDNCKSLTQIKVPNSVERVDGLCNGCTKLKLVSLGRGIKEINFGSFYNCPNLKAIVCHSQTPPEVFWPNTFTVQTYKSVILYVPKGSKEKYMAKPEWKKFVNIREGEPTDMND